MKTFLFLILAGYAVRCDDSNYYVVQMPDNDVLRTKEFKVYWNSPTMQCKSKKILFDDLYEKYGIIQNTGDTFRGDRISILYDPGDFPALLRNSSSGEIKYRNGGVPQEGDLIKHLDTFQKVLEQSVPDKNFNGVGIIDFESWRPVLRQNFGVLTPYKDVSYEIEKKRHWWWKKQWIEEEAKRRFEKAGREFMQATLSLSKKMRPHAVWGYYGFPYCFNMAYNSRKEACANNVPQENDGIDWLWAESTALYPSVYSSDDITADQLAGLIRGRVREAARVAHSGAPILPYVWYRYRDKGFFSESDLDVALSTLYKSNASGFIIWGSSNDVNTIEKCKNLRKYITDTFGPAVAKYTKGHMRVGDDSDETFTGVYNPNNASKYDPEYTWIPPVNYTQKVEEMVEKELQEEKEAAVTHKNINESILVDMILHKIANYCADGCNNKSKVRPTDEKEGDSGINESRVVLVTEDPFKKTSAAIAVTVPTTTEEDIYDYDLNTEDVIAGENYETNDYIAKSTTSMSIETSTTVKSVDEVSKTTSRTEKINLVDNSEEIYDEINEYSNKVYISKEPDSVSNITTQETSTIAFATAEAEENNNKIVIQEINAVDLSTEENNSADESSTENSPPTLSTKDTTINELSTTSSSEREETSIIRNYISIDENKTESNSKDIDFIDISTEDSSTINPNTSNASTTVGDDFIVEPNVVDYGTTEEPRIAYNGSTEEPSVFDSASTAETSAIDNRTSVVNKSDSSTTVAPVFTEQVVVSVV